MRVSVREGKCKGYGFCADLAPNAYELDASGYNALVGRPPATVPPDLEAEAREGALACPLRALLVEESDDDEPHEHARPAGDGTDAADAARAPAAPAR